jgi:Helicase conserved C-terminal domain
MNLPSRTSLHACARAWDAEQRERVAHLWGIEDPSRSDEELCGELGQHMRLPFFARAVWQHLSSEERRCLMCILEMPSAPKGVRLDTLPKKVRLPMAVVESAIERLVTHWCLLQREQSRAWASQTRGGLAELIPVVLLIPLQGCRQALHQTMGELATVDPPEGEPLASLLQRRGDLERIASRYGVASTMWDVLTPRLSRFMEVHERQRAAVCEQLTRPFVVFVHLQRLPESARQLVRWLVARGGCVRFAEACQQHAITPALLDVLEAEALAFDTLLADGDRVLLIPHAILAAVCSAIEEYQDLLQQHALVPQPEPTTIHVGHPVVLSDLAVLVHWCLHQRVTPTKQGTLPKRMQEKIRGQLQGAPRDRDGRDHYLDHLCTLAVALGVLECTASYGEDTARYRPGAHYQTWSTATLAEQAQQVTTWWQRSQTWCEVDWAGHLVSLYSGMLHRRHVLAVLAQCLPETWYACDAVCGALWQAEFDTQIAASSVPSSHSASLQELYVHWRASEEWAVTALFTSTLYELGLVSLGYATESQATSAAGPVWLALTPLGSAVLAQLHGQSDRMVPKDERDLIVQPNFEVIAFQFTPALIYPLLPFVQVQHMGTTCTFRLTQASVRQGLAEGMRVSEMLAMLAEQSRKALPQNVEYTLQDWAAGFQGATLTEVILVETSHDYTQEHLQQLVGLPTIQVRRLAPTLYTLTRLTPHVSYAEITRQFERAQIAVHWHPVGR